MTPTILVSQIKEAVIRQEGTHVVVIVNGITILDIPWDAAIVVAQGMIAQARKCEEIAKAPQIISDQALLLRAGVPLALTTRPDMLKEAGNQAAWDSDLRRYLPDNIDQSGIVYAPEVRHQHE